MTIKFLYTNIELNLPHHLSYVTALPCKTNTLIGLIVHVIGALFE